MTQMPEYMRGFKDGVKRAVTWLHNEADRMNDPHAAQVLRSTAFGLGAEEAEELRKKRRRIACEKDWRDSVTQPR